VRFSQLFEDELTLDNLSRPQLKALCKYAGTGGVGVGVGGRGVGVGVGGCEGSVEFESSVRTKVRAREIRECSMSCSDRVT